MAEELNRCPFCGNDDENKFLIANPVAGRVAIECTECNSRGPLVASTPFARRAVDAWNERASDRENAES